jgi:hypothetical protein
MLRATTEAAVGLVGMVVATMKMVKDMTSPPEANFMDEKAIRSRIAELSEALSSLAKSDGPDGQAGAYVSDRPSPGGSAEELLDALRLQIKYLAFDLEATRRENRYLRQMLQRRISPGEGGESI